ncbi:MAG: zinc-ribbon domain containing protein [Clostridia bacterium]|nr:zinc-ribbon domain containing protein [Clostridia bacterium]MBC7348088.1 zinc-ribbon domain containing protein [Clostridia bacterium]
MFQDRTLVCRDCGRTFVFTAGEQEFYAEKGFQNEPSRCPSCRAARRQVRASVGGARRPGSANRALYRVVCADCGREAELPFQPTGGRPVYCPECFSRRRGTARR